MGVCGSIGFSRSQCLYSLSFPRTFFAQERCVRDVVPTLSRCFPSGADPSPATVEKACFYPNGRLRNPGPRSVYPQPRTRPPNRLGMHRRDQSSGHGTSAALALRQRFLAKAGRESEKSLRQRFQSPPPTHPTSCATNSNSPR